MNSVKWLLYNAISRLVLNAYNIDSKQQLVSTVTVHKNFNAAFVVHLEFLDKVSEIYQACYFF